MELRNQRVLLTGATGGIGKQIVLHLLNAGASVLLQGRNIKKLDALRTQFNQFNEKVTVVAGDLLKSEDRNAVVIAASEDKVNCLINNAGVNQFSAFESAEISNLINTNVTATMLLTQALLPMLMRNKEKPLIVNIGSTFGAIGFPGYVSYCASKHAIKGFSEALSREYADTSLQVIYVSPRATNTEMNTVAADEVNRALCVKSDSSEWVASEVIKSIANKVPRSQLGWPEKFHVKLNAILPSLVDGVIAKQLPTIKRYI
ncbi:MAG: SDR family oxidoreductase [Pseudomonadales bacterium]|nr:SDR family oxidoreductase [Pseudomonadales bacterium]